MKRNEFLQFLNDNTYCKIGPSPLHGVGVIAIRQIPRGINPFVGSWEMHYKGYTVKELSVLRPQIRKLIDDYFVVEKGKIFIPTCGLNGLDISYYLNHSDSPNCMLGEENTFKTRSVIEEGEELTFNYQDAYGDLYKDKLIIGL